MDIRETIIAWNPDKDDIKFGLILESGDYDWTQKYTFTAGAAYAFVRSLSNAEAESYILSEAISLIVFNQMTPDYVHETFERIRQYRHALLNMTSRKLHSS